MKKWIIPTDSLDIRDQFDMIIEQRKRESSKSWLAEQLGISVGHFSNILSGRMDLTEKNRKKLNELLGTKIGDNE